MATVKCFEELKVWQEAQQFAIDMFRLTDARTTRFDRDLANQMRRACVSISSNIAEGFEKNSRPEFARYLLIAKGSAGEVRTQLHLAHALKFFDDSRHAELHDRIVKISSMLAKLIKYLKKLKPGGK